MNPLTWLAVSASPEARLLRTIVDRAFWLVAIFTGLVAAAEILAGGFMAYQALQCMGVLTEARP